MTSEKLREIDYSVDDESAFEGPKPEDFEPTVTSTGALLEMLPPKPDFISSVSF